MTATAEPGRRPAAAGRLRDGALGLGLAATLLATALVSLGIGRYGVPVDRVLTIAAGWIGAVDARAAVPETDWRVVELIRAPRILVAALVGAGLALSGAVLQGVFRNPLVGPQLIGVSSGAAFGGALAILFAAGTAAMIGSAFVFGLAAMTVVYALARQGGRTSVLTLVLAGVVVSAFFGALVSLVTYLADPNDSLPAIVFWLMGSFATATFDKALVIGTALGVLGSVLVAMRFRINLLSLGDEEASALGVAVERTRWAALVCVTGIVAASVAVAGIVGWVGLVVPHIARMLVGPDHRRLLPAAAAIGATYTILVDNVARTATAAEIPLGVLTAIIGAPVFAVLLRRTAMGGWRT